MFAGVRPPSEGVVLSDGSGSNLRPTFTLNTGHGLASTQHHTQLWPAGDTHCKLQSYAASRPCPQLLQ